MTGAGPDACVATWRVVVPGTGMIAVTFGLARYGFGLLLPDMHRELGIDPRTGGLIASGAYLSYLAGTAFVVWGIARFGTRTPIAVAAALAAAGMATVATAHGPVQVAAGVMVAGASAGLAFPPYADVVARELPAERRAVPWTTISSGTGWGVALAGPVAIAFGAHWRLAWLVFAGLAAVVGVVAVLLTPPGRAPSSARLPRLRWSWFVCPRSRPLLVGAALLGTGSSVWWVFAVDALRAAGVGPDAARISFVACGIAGVIASLTGTLTRRVGLRRGYLALCLALVCAVAVWGFTGSNTAAIIAAAAFGVSYNAVVGTQGLWNADVFATRPSAGLAAVNTALTAGMITGPALAGLVIHAYGYPSAFLAAAGVIALAMLQPPGER